MDNVTGNWNSHAITVFDKEKAAESRLRPSSLYATSLCPYIGRCTQANARFLFG